jgi:hypothetical protein
MVYFFRFVFWLSMVVGSSATLAPNVLLLGNEAAVEQELE